MNPSKEAFFAMKFRVFISILVAIPFGLIAQPKADINTSSLHGFEEFKMLVIDSHDPQFIEGRYDLSDYLTAPIPINVVYPHYEGIGGSNKEQDQKST